MPDKLLLSTSYLPPVEYFYLISKAQQVYIEREENYVKQSYRNRCCILSAHGRQSLSVPVLFGTIHKTKLKDTRIDYSKRWQQVHLGAIKASYGSSPYFQFYFEEIESIINLKNSFLLDLNMKLTNVLLKFLKVNKVVDFTTRFEPPSDSEYDYRYKLSPKTDSGYKGREYIQVFSGEDRFVNNLSVIDLIFNTGPEATEYL